MGLTSYLHRKQKKDRESSEMLKQASMSNEIKYFLKHSTYFKSLKLVKKTLVLKLTYYFYIVLKRQRFSFISISILHDILLNMRLLLDQYN